MWRRSGGARRAAPRGPRRRATSRWRRRPRASPTMTTLQCLRDGRPRDDGVYRGASAGDRAPVSAMCTYVRGAGRAAVSAAGRALGGYADRHRIRYLLLRRRRRSFGSPGGLRCRARPARIGHAARVAVEPGVHLAAVPSQRLGISVPCE
eukprot:3704588-Prymnesium_polylepis.1